MTLLYIGDSLVDLYQDTVISLTVQKIDIGDVSRRNVSYTNNIKIPWTENNARIFGYSFSEKSTSSIPYSLTSCKIVQDGVEILSSANCIINKSFGNKNFSIDIYEKVYDYFSTIKGKTLADINPIANSAWNAAGIDAARTNTSGIIAAVLHWGKSGAIYQVNYFLPCFYYHTIITAILEYTGLDISGDILTDARFTDLVIPYPGNEFLYPESVIQSFPAKGYRAVNQTLTGLLDTPKVQLNLDTIAYGSNISTGSNRYTFPSDGISVTATVTATVRVGSVTFNDASRLNAQLVRNTSTQLDLAFAAGPNTTLSLSYTGSFSPGDTVEVLLYSDAVSPDVGLDATLEGGADLLQLTVTPSTTINRSDVYWNSLWPEISCEDLLKDFFTRFSIIPKLVGNTLILKSIEDIITDRSNSIDWSGKLVNADTSEIDFSLGYARNNNFDYQDSEDVGQPELGRGVIVIVNDAVEEKKDIYHSLFGNSLITELSGGYRVALIPVYDADSTGIDTFAMEPGLRLLTLKARTTESAITFNVSSRTDYKLAYFVDPLQSKDTGWQYFVDEFYASLSEALQKNKKLKKTFLLDSYDIISYDPHKTVWDGTTYSITDKIINFISGKLTKVDLFKVS